MSALELLGVVDRWTLFAALLVTTGVAAFRFLVLHKLAARDAANEALCAAIASRAATLGAAASLAALVAVAMRLPLQVVELRDDTMPLVPQVQALGFHTMWGAVWLYQIAILLGAAVAFARARGGRHAAWVGASVLAVMASVSPALSGHAIASERLGTLAVIADALHVVGAGAWLGAMVALAAGLTLARRDATTGGRFAAAMVSAFSSLALIAASCVLATGVFAAWLHLGTFSDLWQSRYGSALFRKLIAVATMAAAGAWNWKRSGPALARSGDVAPMARGVRLEIGIGILVLLATSLLVVIPQPGQE